QNYKTWLTGLNSKGEQPQFNAESDARVKKFVVDSVGGDDILRKMMMLNFITDGIIDKSLADIYIMKKLVGDK
ncbi:MAG: hypothetical protein II453_01300, partial [Alphaproteobacteria bacterium]|nr:hypothetical protein [Alphaproteobacteria bacterium]